MLEYKVGLFPAVMMCGKLYYQNRPGEEVRDRSEFAPILFGWFLVSLHQWFRGECLIKERAMLSVTGQCSKVDEKCLC